MRKRIAIFTLALALCLGLAACGGETDGAGQEPASAPGETEETGPAEGAGGEGGSGEQAGSGDLGDYRVEIKGAELTEDYEGKPVIVITYAWTNNGEDTTSAMVAVAEKAFQDGVQLERALVMNDEVYDSGAGMKEVRPGTTLDIQCAYELTSETSTVEFEITEWISFSDGVVTMDFEPADLK
ncbi:DUF5067 domain-containing protein [Oscillibacter sp.]|jgi:hypothetical protein|uniref:DUF5067 domain-containing protein n=1 Tax=Oscillibacter sp. TaxID=1945593 RepID=UPI00216F04C4|nr:DUF5067 domain-containing protein [Oscillibacter sp.]MCI9649316.1 DUF5067 domain-containing protein [Oscillibacter sp.]